MIRSLLIANRGEIACRIVRTARRMGVRTIAVFSDADADALHVAVADAAVRIGAPPPRASYLNIPAIVDAARRAGADAVHPGYGFLSENPAFVEACDAAGLVFVGPPASAMRAMGSKANAKALMERAGVPLLSGYHGEQQDSGFLADQAARAGFPVVIKAVAGGGGRGMRVVRAAGNFVDALDSARREAAGAFGDDRVLIERYLDRPRHIEVQVFADTHGNAIHLFERDCSAQRRHQKVIEEAPAPGLDAARRDAMGQAAVAAAKAVGYVGAGTVEFVADDHGFFFLEMNTRLQVEHPVTEVITGTDLVEWQLRVASGEKLPLAQDRLSVRGHAIEVRLYAEDPARDYAPSVGRLTAFHVSDPTARVDTGVRAGDEITVHYDPMIAKLIVHGDTRAEAIARMRRALASTSVAGVTTNLDLLSRLLAHPDFAAGAIDTGSIARHADTLLAPPEPPDAAALAVAAVCVLAEEAHAAPTGDSWDATDGWWLNAAPWRTLTFLGTDGPLPVRLRAGAGGWETEAGFLRVAATDTPGVLRVERDGLREDVGFTRAGSAITLHRHGAILRLRLEEDADDGDDAADAASRLVAPLPGQVTQVVAEPGASVARGALLLTLEAMKTLFRLTAPADATVATVACRAGDTVQEGQVLVTFATDEPS